MPCFLIKTAGGEWCAVSSDAAPAGSVPAPFGWPSELAYHDVDGAGNAVVNADRKTAWDADRSSDRKKNAKKLVKRRAEELRAAGVTIEGTVYRCIKDDVFALESVIMHGETVDWPSIDNATSVTIGPSNAPAFLDALRTRYVDVTRAKYAALRLAEHGDDWEPAFAGL